MRRKVFYAGDSIAQYNDYTTFPQTGMGQGLQIYLKPDVQLVNYARNGRSTKSFIDEGRLKRIEEEIQEGDLLLIQFGHNDEKMEDPTRGTLPFESFQENLMQFVTVARNHGALPVLITSLSRRIFDKTGKIDRMNHGDYPKAVVALADREKLPVIDLCTMSMDLLDEIGMAESKRYYMNFEAGLYSNYPDGKEDNSHLRYDGAVLFAGVVAEGLKKLGGQYAQFCVTEDMTEEEKAIESAMLKDW